MAGGELELIPKERIAGIFPRIRTWFSRFFHWLRFVFDFHRWNTAIHHAQTKFLIWFKEGSGYVPVRLFRRYSAFAFVLSSGLVVSLANATEDAGGLATVAEDLGLREEASVHIKLIRSAQVMSPDDLALVPLAANTKSVDPNEKESRTIVDEMAISPENQMFLAAALGSNSAREPEQDGGVKIYTVAQGDTVSGIAQRFDITVNTILWANELDNVDAIRPGDQIFIMPVVGFNYVVQSGDTIDSLSSKYKADKERIIAFNGLPANGELTVGEKIVLPDGQKEIPAPRPSGDALAPRQYASSSGGAATDITPSFSRPKEGKIGQGHRFPYGYCTWYVAQKRYVPWGGNAGTWLFNARAYGYKTGKTPTVGSIVVTTEDRYYGHVAFVEKVNKDTITVSEMNYTGWGKKSVRQLARSSRVIKGYVY